MFLRRFKPFFNRETIDLLTFLNLCNFFINLFKPWKLLTVLFKPCYVNDNFWNRSIFVKTFQL
jgi:hypothetical protein